MSSVALSRHLEHLRGPTVEGAVSKLLFTELALILLGELPGCVLFPLEDNEARQDMVCIAAWLVHVVAAVTYTGIAALFANCFVR